MLAEGVVELEPDRVNTQLPYGLAIAAANAVGLAVDGALS
jgi:hypothetical protein